MFINNLAESYLQKFLESFAAEQSLRMIEMMDEIRKKMESGFY
jgi:hypothetical protein